MKRLKKTQRPIILTVNGKPEAVVQSAAEYQRLLDLAALADPEEGLRQGLEDIAKGRTRPAREVFAELFARNMAYEVRLAKRAINDLRHIYKTIEADTSQTADVWFRGLESAIPPSWRYFIVPFDCVGFYEKRFALGANAHSCDETA